MNAHKEALARDFLKMTDTQRDIFTLLTDDIVFTYPKWGTARGKEELGRSTRILAPMCKRYPMIQTLLTA